MAKTLARCRVFKHEPFLQVFGQMVCYCMEHLQGIHSYSQCCNYCRLRAGCLLLSFWTVFVFAWWNSVLDFLVIMLYCVLPGFEMGSNCFSLNVHLQNICRPNLEVPTCVPVTHRKVSGTFDWASTVWKPSVKMGGISWLQNNSLQQQIFSLKEVNGYTDGAFDEIFLRQGLPRPW